VRDWLDDLWTRSLEDFAAFADEQVDLEDEQ
jgi:hypothetical protein